MSKAATQSKAQIFLDELDLNVMGLIVAMICRKWDVNAVTGRYLCTDFLISDGSGGNTTHCTAKSNTSHNFSDRLKEGIIYTINDFAVLPNIEDYQIKKESAYMIEFHGGTTVRRSSVKADGFVRHPFDLINFDDLQVTNNKYWEHSTEDGFKDPRFLPHESKGHTMGKPRRCVNRKENKECWPSCRDSNFDKLYLSSTSSTLILNDVEIPTMKESTSEAS
ncbi:hypothetical protein OROHE_012674 [Orobanche hederae]